MIPVLTLRGTAFEMGRSHGAAHREAIRAFARERVRLAGDPAWTGRSLDRDGVLALADACWDHHVRYAPDLAEEARGMARATGLTPAELVVVGGFTDFIDAVHASGAADRRATAPHGAMNCTAFLVPNGRASGGGMMGQTWDMHQTATEHVLLVEGAPDGGVDFLTFTSAGCVGMIGMNAHGIVVGINNLSGADGRIGVTWPFVVRKALAQTSFGDALACIEDAPLAGAHNYLLMDAEGRGANVEAMARRVRTTPLEGDVLVHTNHVLHADNAPFERPKDPPSLAGSRARLARGEQLLARHDLDPEALMAVTRDGEAICYTGVAPRFVATCGAVVARPATRELWAVRGLPSEAPYRRFTLA